MSRKVEMVRMAPDESFTAAADRERSAAEVFGSATKFQKVDKATLDKALEGKTTKFLSEAELQKNKERHGGSLEDGTFSGRTLTEAILAQREEKEQKFQEGWKTMKQGKNRPLEPDEVEFLNGLAKEEAMKEKKKRQEEEKLIKRMEEIQKSAQPVAPVAQIRGVAPKPRPVARRPVSVVKRNPNPTAPKEPQAAAAATPAGASKGSSPPAPVAAAPGAGLGLVSGYDSSDSDE